MVYCDLAHWTWVYCKYFCEGQSTGGLLHWIFRYFTGVRWSAHTNTNTI